MGHAHYRSANYQYQKREKVFHDNAKQAAAAVGGPSGV
jgi:hypothetical protein